jgi:hypothetical protein
MEIENTNPAPSKWNTVTPFSKWASVVVFIAMPFVGFWAGMHYAPAKVTVVNEYSGQTRPVTKSEHISSVGSTTVLDSTNQQSFRLPVVEESTHIVNAKIKELQIQDCPPTSCSVTVVDQIEGVPDSLVQKINTMIAEEIIEESSSDVRSASGSLHLRKNITHIDHYTFTISYIDRGVIGYYKSAEMDYEGDMHSVRDLGTYGFFLIKDGTVLRDHEVPLFSMQSDAENILNKMYPNGREILSRMISTDVALEECYKPNDFPTTFKPQVRLSSKEVIFEPSFSHALTGVCSGVLQIAVPIEDILREAPEFVPEDSVLKKV